jgi:hypothetical protein
MKPKKCAYCKEVFTPDRPMQKACSMMCAIEIGKKASAKKASQVKAVERKETKAKLDAMQTKPQLVKKAQVAFNAYCRARDMGKPCISCGKPLGSEPNTYDAGHWRSVGSAPHMRFVEDNVHGQCKHCNNYLAGNAVEYRKGLIERLGLERVEAIECDQNHKKYTKDDLIEIAKHYREQARQLLKDGVQ